MNDLCTDDMTLEAIEKAVILKRFKRFANNKTATAQTLGITAKTLNAKLDRYAQEAHREAQRQENDRVQRLATLIKAAV